MNVVPSPRIGLCLSGGGFRASFYSLGVLRYLAEAGHLQDVVSVSTVSGGSIVAAVLADRAGELAANEWTVEAFLTHVDAPFRQVVTQKNLRNRWLAQSVGARLIGRRVGRGVVLGEVLSKHLYRTHAVCDLSAHGPQVIFTTTDLITGRSFRISRDFIGSYDFGYMEPPPPSITVGFAAAASAAAPLFFPPASLPIRDIGLRNAPTVLSLADGGIYDNLGLEWFQGWDSGRPQSAVKPDFLVVVNAGGPLKPVTRPFGGVRGILRAKDVQYSQTTNLRTRWFVRDLLRGSERGIYVGIGQDPRQYQLPDGAPIAPDLYRGALPSPLVAPLSRLRTDLDRFSSNEAVLLSYHGYWSTHSRLAALHPDSACASPRWTDFAELNPGEAQRLRVNLTVGAKRMRWPAPGR